MSRSKNLYKKYFKPISIALPLLLIYFYRFSFSYFVGRNCRFAPTCSEYALIAFKRFGLFKGMSLTLKRLSSCSPYGKAGYDPVPEKE